MVQGDRQYLLGGPQPHQRGTQQRALAQVERTCAVGEQQCGQLFVTAGQVHHRQHELRGGVHHLHATAVDRVQGGAQRLVACSERGERPVHGVHVQLAPQPHGEPGDVLGALRLELVQEPQSLLGEGQWQRGVPCHQGNRVGPLRAELARHPGDRGVAEHRTRGHLDVQGRPEPRGHLDADDRVAAQLEEVVLDADPVDLQRLRPHLGDQPLRVVARGHVPGGRTGRVRGGQRRPVELSVAGQRDRLHRHERLRHHVFRQRGSGQLTQLRRGRRDAVGDHVGHQPFAARVVLPGDHGDLRGCRVCSEHGLDLAQLDPEPADLHLVVGPTEVLQLAVRVPAHDVPAAVHPRSGRAERVGHEPFGGQARPVEVAARQAGTGHAELTGHAGWDGSQLGVEHVDAQVGDWHADHAGGPAAVQRHVGDVHGGLGDPVHVDQQRGVLGMPRIPLREPPGVQRLAAEDHVPQRQFRTVIGSDQLVERRRGLVEHRDPLFGEQPQEVLRRPGHGVRHHDEPTAVQQRPPQLPHREVEGVGVEQRPHVPVVEAEPVAGGREQPHHIGMRHHHALGSAGGPGGVDHVGRILRQQRHLSEVLGPVTVQIQFLAGQHQHRIGVRQHRGDPLGRVARIDGQVGGTGLEHREHGHDQVNRAVQDQRHEAFRTRAPLHEVPRQPVGPRIELGVGDRRVPAGHRDRVRCAAHLPLEQLRQRDVHLGGLGPVPAHQHLVPVGLVEQRQPRDRPVGLADHLGEQRAQRGQQLPGGARVEQPGVVGQVHVQLLGQVGAHAQRETGGVDRVDPADPQSGRGGGGLVERVVLEHHGAVEQAAASGQITPGTQLCQ